MIPDDSNSAMDFVVVNLVYYKYIVLVQYISGLRLIEFTKFSRRNNDAIMNKIYSIVDGKLNYKKYF